MSPRCGPPDPRSFHSPLHLDPRRLALLLVLFSTPSLPAGADVLSRVHPHAPTTTMLQRAGLTSAQAPPHLLYYGGPVIRNVKVVMVNWTSLVDATLQAKLPVFYSQMVNSTAMDWLCEYDTYGMSVNNTPGTHQHIGRGVFWGAVTIAPLSNPTTISNSSIQAELTRQIGLGSLPAPDSNTVYAVSFPPGQTIAGPPGAGNSCVQFCAFHDNYLAPFGMVRYLVLPDVSSCAAGCGDGVLLDDETAMAWHELIECVTDPDVETSLAWYDMTSGEIGDYCDAPGNFVAFTPAGTPWSVQKLWSNLQASCVLTGPSCQRLAVDDAPPLTAALEVMGANPLRGVARLRYALPATVDVDLSVFDVAGRRVASLAHGTEAAGDHTVTWSPEGTRAGVYFARLLADGRVISRTLVLRP